jgi:isoamylase
VLNSHHDLVNFTLPEYPDGETWDLLLDTDMPERTTPYKGRNGAVFGITGRSLFLFIRAL